MRRDKVLEFRRKIEHMASLQTDEQALDSIEMFPSWESKIGQWVNTNERYRYDERLYKVLQPHQVSAQWAPDIAVSLYVEVSAAVWPEIPENITAENPWMAGQKGSWRGEHYICRIDYCVWNPDQLPSAWKKQ